MRLHGGAVPSLAQAITDGTRACQGLHGLQSTGAAQTRVAYRLLQAGLHSSTAPMWHGSMLAGLDNLQVQDRLAIGLSARTCSPAWNTDLSGTAGMLCGARWSQFLAGGVVTGSQGCCQKHKPSGHEYGWSKALRRCTVVCGVRRSSARLGKQIFEEALACSLQLFWPVLCLLCQIEVANCEEKKKGSTAV